MVTVGGMLSQGASQSGPVFRAEGVRTWIGCVERRKVMARTKVSGLIVGGLCFMLFLMSSPGNLGAQAPKEPIRIGIDTEMTGVMSETSMNCKQGYDLYLQEIGYKVAGRPIKVI